MKPRQPDLFAPPPEAPAERDPALLDYTRLTIQRIVEPFLGAERLPCSLTAATVAEIRVDGLCNMLPEPEGSETRAAFFAELNRLYALVPTEPEEEGSGA